MKISAFRGGAGLFAAFSAILMGLVPVPALAQAGAEFPKGPQPGSEEVAAVVEEFHAALAAGDSTAALALLSEDVVILENGRSEDRDHYRSGHLAGDIRFAQAVHRERSGITVHMVGNVAWAHSTNATRGRMGDREIDALGAELMVLVRDVDGWTIRAIHWSSRSRTP